MDRDYRTKLDEIEEMLANGQEEEAFDTLANVNWRKVHNVSSGYAMKSMKKRGTGRGA